jgi:O-antigen ligase
LTPTTKTWALIAGATALACGAAIALLPLSTLLVLAGAVVALALAGLILVEPVIGLALTLFSAPFGPLENILLHLPVESGQALLFLTLAAWLVRAVVRRRLALRNGPLLWPLLLFLVVGVLSFFAARSFELWAKETLKWVEVLAVYVLVVSEISDNPRARHILIAGILIPTLFEAVLGIYQFGLRGAGPHEFAIAGARFYRAYGTFEQPNPFGGYMGLTWPFALGLALYLSHRVWQGMRNRMPLTTRVLGLYALTALAWLIAALAVVALVLSWSRGAWLGAGAATLVLFMALLRRPAASLALLAVIVVSVITFNLTDLLPASLRNRLTDFTNEFSSLDVRGVNVNDANYSVIERLAHWQAAQNMIMDRPYLGVGFGNYTAAYEQYRTLNWPIALGHAHNYYLNIFAETGILGLTAYLILWGSIAARTLWVYGTRKGARARPLLSALAFGLLGTWVQLSVHNVVDNLYVANIFLLIGVYLGLLDGVTHEQTRVSR